MVNEELLKQSVDILMDALPGVWDRIRSNLRAAAIDNFDITLEQFHVLRHIRAGYDSVAVLAAKKQISCPAVSQSVEVLVTKGLVTREINPKDRRSSRLNLTSYAHAVMDANGMKNREWMKEQIKALTPDELKKIIETMEILRETFNPDRRED